MEKVALQPSQYWGRSGGSRLYFSKSSFRHSCAPRSVPFTVDCCTLSHSPVFVSHSNQHAPWNRAPARVSARASSALRTLRFCTYDLPSQMQAEWSAVRNSSWPQSAATRCPVMTQDAFQFSGLFLLVQGVPGPPVSRVGG